MRLNRLTTHWLGLGNHGANWDREQVRHVTVDVAVAFASMPLQLLASDDLHVATAASNRAVNAAHPVEARISRWLLEVQDRCGGSDIPLTQTTLAEMLGVQRTTINLAAGRLEAALYAAVLHDRGIWLRPHQFPIAYRITTSILGSAPRGQAEQRP
jgi:DNA-binding transcriptional LysR family regulator